MCLSFCHYGKKNLKKGGPILAHSFKGWPHCFWAMERQMSVIAGYVWYVRKSQSRTEISQGKIWHLGHLPRGLVLL